MDAASRLSFIGALDLASVLPASLRPSRIACFFADFFEFFAIGLFLVPIARRRPTYPPVGPANVVRQEALNP